MNELKKLNILIVDDEAHLIELIGCSVEEAVGSPCNIVTRYDQSTALAALESKKFDLVITDFNIPAGKEGAAIAQAAKRLWKAKVMVVSGALTTSAGAGIRALCGADAYLAKPYQLEEAVKMISDLLALVVPEEPILARP